eukprot:TRINITY_DN1241_c0_g1::TRINITY_DN1241_c0_g1_i1::g.26799::m.26799 TRINITY_DN1241_c0_g1::TRINITY_DN1241_c0_g1_i1::g.26799  ORF type:complete len:321 (+),score=52.18,sp/Q8LBF7/SWET7_ARATH/32.54/2e-21,MtN3_slv/PF03083.11/3.9e-15,MtN3_slv/PF03083.11/9.2e+03,MtN3_slv/PF03083.11/1.3e-18 TRINITY_DN1241_c0_g1_i1:48-965(+)
MLGFVSPISSPSPSGSTHISSETPRKVAFYASPPVAPTSQTCFKSTPLHQPISDLQTSVPRPEQKINLNNILLPAAVALAAFQPFTAFASSLPAQTGILGSILPLTNFIFFFFLQISGLKTISLISSKKSIGDFSVLPFLSLAVNCVIWVIYGVLKSAPAVVWPNVSGMLLGFLYLRLYHSYATPAQRTDLANNWYLPAIGILGTVLMLTVFAPTALAVHYIGLIGCVLAVLLLSSPLAVLRTVLKNRNTAAMPFATSLGGFLNSLSWTLYGLLVANDIMIWGPNALGFLASTVQMILLFTFPSH